MPPLPDRTRQELAAPRQELAALRGLHGRKRLAHIWAYYKAPIVIALILLYIAGYAVYRQATQKEDALYLALVNVEPGAALTEQLTEGFAQAQDFTPKQQVYLYTGLLLSEREGADQEYVYASEMRITAAVTAQRLDVLLMNAEARDAFARPRHRGGGLPRGGLSRGAGQRPAPRPGGRLHRLPAGIRKEQRTWTF